MISLTALAAAAVAVTVGGTGTAAFVLNTRPAAVDAATTLTASANANLHAAEQAHQRALEALRSNADDAKAEASGQIETGKARLDQAGIDMRAAVDTGSQTAKHAVAEFTAKSVALMNSLTVTASATAHASTNAASAAATAANQRVQAARAAAAAQRGVAEQRVAQARADASDKLAKAAASRNTLSHGVSRSGAGTEASAGAESSTTTSGGPAAASGSATGNVGVNVG